MGGWPDNFGDNDLGPLLRNREPEEGQVSEPVQEIEEYDLIEPSAIKKEDRPDTKNEKNKNHHSVKLTEEEEEWFQQIMTALGTTIDSTALKWCLKNAYKANEEKIKRIVKKRQRIETL